LISSLYSQSCLDNNNNQVDWWVAYKIPKLTDQNFHDGLEYAYMDDKTSQFNIPSTLINNPSSFVGRTLNQLYQNHTNIGYILWNDEPPEGSPNSARAHAKGLLVFSTNGGFFYRHSVPLFPPKKKNTYSYPDTGTVYGQTMLCLNLDLNNIETIAAQFLVNFPQVYDSYVPPELSKFKSINSLAKDVHDNSKKTSIVNIKTKNGLMVTDYAKNHDWNNDLWDSLVAPNIQDSLMVESWGRPLMPSNCNGTKYQTLNILDVKISSSATFHESKDHSKWGISERGSTTCIGDINRMISQRKRGGGTSCLTIASVYKQFSSIISNKDKC